MTVAAIKSKIAEYPVGFGSLLVVLLAGGFLYARSDVETALAQEREAKLKERDEMVANEREAKRLPEDLKRARELYSKVTSIALDLNSPIAVQSFLAEFLQKEGTKVSLPRQQAKPAPCPGAKAMATCSYVMEFKSGYSDLLRYIDKLQTNPKRAMVVSRVDVGTPSLGGEVPSDSHEPGALSSTLAFRLWGRSEELPKLVSTPDKKVGFASDRVNRLKAAEACLSPSARKFDSICLLFGESAGSKEAPDKPESAGYEELLATMDVSIVTFMGAPALRIKGLGTKRVNNEFELLSGNQPVKFKIASIEADAFTVVTNTGKRIKVSSKK